VGTIFRETKQATIDMEEMFKLLDQPSKIVYGSQAVAKDPNVPAIGFHNVTFRYEEEDHVLKDLSFEIKQGQTVGFVGPSGWCVFSDICLSWGVVFQEITRYSIQALSVRVSFVVSSFRCVGCLRQFTRDEFGFCTSRDVSDLSYIPHDLRTDILCRNRGTAF
jgi:hypothetical protein